VSQRIRKSTAVLSVLGRLGFHAKPGDVVAELAKYGIEVSAGLVQKVRIEAAKATSGIRRRRAVVAERRPRVSVVRKIPRQRSQER
jgi:hypothetical protein